MKKTKKLIISDPCYVLRDDVYQKLINIMKEDDFTEEEYTLKNDQHEAIVKTFDTKEGDGCYNGDNGNGHYSRDMFPAGRYGVDSGMVAVITDDSVCDGVRENDDYYHVFNFDKEVNVTTDFDDYILTVYVNGDKFTSISLKPDDCNDYYEEEEDEDEDDSYSGDEEDEE